MRSARKASLIEEEIEEADHCCDLGLSSETASDLLTAHGVISALVIAFVVGLQTAVTKESTAKVDFQSLICCYGGFRKYVIDVMKDPDFGNVGKYQFEAFNFNVPTFEGQGTVFNITEQLLGSAWRFNDVAVQTTLSDTMDCLEDPTVGTVVLLLLPDFPMQMVDMWLLKHPVINGREVYTWGIANQFYVSMSCGLLLGTLILSLFQYIGLSLSGAKSNNDAGMGIWNFFNFGFIIINYFLLIVGIGYFLTGQIRWVVAQHIQFKRSLTINKTIGMYSVFIPLGIIGLVIMCLTVAVSWTFKFKRIHKKSARDFDESPMGSDTEPLTSGP